MSGAIMDVTSTAWNTPPEIVEAVQDIMEGIDLDPCSNPFSMVGAKRTFSLEEGTDGLTEPWHFDRRIFVNPPWGREVHKWMQRAYSASSAGSDVVMLVPAATETKAWEQWVWPCCQRICFIQGRIEFWLNGKPAGASCTRPAALLLYSRNGNTIERFDTVAWGLGEVVTPLAGGRYDRAA